MAREYRLLCISGIGPDKSDSLEEINCWARQGYTVKHMQAWDGRVYFLMERRIRDITDADPERTCGNCRWFTNGTCGEDGWSWCLKFSRTEMVRVADYFRGCRKFQSAREWPADPDCLSCAFNNGGVCAMINSPVSNSGRACDYYKPGREQSK